MQGLHSTSTRLVAFGAFAIFLFAFSPANAVEKCKVKVDKKTGVIRIDASGVQGTLLWGADAASITNAFFNDASCRSGTSAKKCELADPDVLAAKSPPAGCTIYLSDDGASDCSVWIRGCVPGARETGLAERVDALEGFADAVHERVADLEAIHGITPPPPPRCPTLTQNLNLTVRDFSIVHPDFESYVGTTPTLGLVESTVGMNWKPVYAHPGATAVTTGPAEFDQWYNDVGGVNLALPVTIPLTYTAPDTWEYVSGLFFPIDGLGFGNEGYARNYHFTTEFRAYFEYRGGEQLTFEGDDDAWVFLNGELVIDLGGVHASASDTVDVDTVAPQLGLVIGEVYDIDFFHAERRTTDSNFIIRTNICFEP